MPEQPLVVLMVEDNSTTFSQRSVPGGTTTSLTRSILLLMGKRA